MELLRAGRTRLQRLALRIPELVPPPEFASRIEKLPDGSSHVNNDMYDDSGAWDGTDRMSGLATLHLLNAARVPYFDRIWAQQLSLPPSREGARFLEVGCGGGIATAALARQVAFYRSFHLRCAG